ncbi:RAS guanyl-releasing protein 4 isoform X5 [Bos indicus x Bos taurus]|uniref:RAS guanyl releasing protein 4 n=1 Tax=Bos indicus x Bos taurus TaxID=30522 RepID=A0A4W2CD94_BOBOX|nr:RAS guanyl-releasing protein 4 isoform X4 [Bos taurus]XP_027371727.1 RAS guanyl-releasing protein 4 isoform X5 [Bos indicus x Bos taurus]XP_061244118.1 RAS guanyl-releasing protein 4 isoform X5 [Bos javanicus]
MNRKDSKRKSHQECPVKTGGRGRPRQARRHKTCPSPREISKVMASMALGMLNEGGCSEDELLEKCIQSFDSAGSLRRGDHVLNMVLAMHSWVLPSAHFAARLLTLYQEATGSTQELRRLQICHLVRYWLTQHPETMHQDPQLEEVIGRFWATVEQEGNSVQQSLGDFSSRLSPGGPGPPHPMSSPGLGKKRKVSLLFDHLETGELAEHLTYLEFRSFQAITLSLDLFYTEDEIYELSYAREPRCPKSLPPSPFKAPLVVEWAPGVTPKPDTVTLGRHVEQLVESVFKNYDPDGRGTISQEDFERLSGNFPFACHGLHPPPCQGSGSFSREELTGYLLRASAICSKLGLAFLHTFQEVTFRKPTFCNSCSGFLWGVTKQGYRCRDCGLCCHRHCRDQVKVECKKRPGAKGDASPPEAPVPPTPVPQASCGSEDNLSYTLSLEPETGCHVRHAWTQTESPHPSWEPETVPLPAKASPPTESSKLNS